MKLYGLLAYDSNYDLISSNYNLDDFFVLFRSKVSAAIENIAAKLVHKVEKDNYYKIDEEWDDNKISLYCCTFDTIYIAITSRDYPKTAANTLLTSLRASGNNTNLINNLFLTYQNPQETDKIEKVKKELEETKFILFDSIDKLMIRGEKIDNLADRARALEISSKELEIETIKMNRCCVIL